MECRPGCERSYKRMDSEMSLTAKPAARETLGANRRDKLLRRSNKRQPFTASALVFEPKSEMLLRARTADLGLDGCFIDTLNPFPTGTLVKLRIEKSGTSFEGWAKVVYSLASMGMGLVFKPAGPEQLWVLHEWLDGAGRVLAPELTLPRIEEEISARHPAEADRTRKDVRCEALSELIEELMGRGVISGEKGEAILQKLSGCVEAE